jgi:uncharacterized integral membrane protein (TIGR00697 family)
MKNAQPSGQELAGTPEHPKNFKYFDLIMAAFITLLLCSNLIGVTKIWHFMGISTTGSILFFPISYLFGDILTEVYGYDRSRKVVWAGFLALLFASFVSWFIIALPPADGWNNQAALETVFGQTPRIVLASLTAYFIGEFTNSYVLAKMKIFTRGQWLWSRILGSTIIGEGIDTLVFYPLAFLFAWPMDLLLHVMATNYVIKVVWEALMIPFTYKIVNFLKRAEQEDHFDFKTNFSPFSIRN